MNDAEKSAKDWANRAQKAEELLRKIASYKTP